MSNNFLIVGNMDDDFVIDTKVRVENVISGLGDPVDPPVVPEKSWLYFDKSQDPVSLWVWDTVGLMWSSAGSVPTTQGGLSSLTDFRVLPNGRPLVTNGDGTHDSRAILDFFTLTGGFFGGQESQVIDGAYRCHTDGAVTDDDTLSALIFQGVDIHATGTRYTVNLDPYHIDSPTEDDDDYLFVRMSAVDGGGANGYDWELRLSGLQSDPGNSDDLTIVIRKIVAGVPTVLATINPITAFGYPDINLATGRWTFEIDRNNFLSAHHDGTQIGSSIHDTTTAVNDLQGGNLFTGQHTVSGNALPGAWIPIRWWAATEPGIHIHSIGTAQQEINVNLLVGAPTDAVVTGDGQTLYSVPSKLNGATLVAVNTALATEASIGTNTVQVARVRGGSPVDTMSTPSTIDVAEATSYTATAPSVVNTSNADMATGDFLRVDVDVAGTDAAGLQVILTFLTRP